MRIALVITELYPGGAERCLVNLAKFLHKRGHDVCVWQLWPTPPDDRGQLLAELESQGIRWKSCQARKATSFLRAIRQLRQELQEFAPDVIQSFLFHANVACSIAARKNFFSAKPALTAKFFGGVRVRQPQAIRWRLQNYASRRMAKLICVSQAVAEHCETKEKIPKDRIEIIPNGIKLQSPHTPVCWSSLDLRAEQPVVLFVGRLDEQKQVIEMLKTSRNWLGALPNHQLVLMGDGPQRHVLENLLKGDEEHFSRVHLVGWHPNPIAWMQASQLVILPAAYEGMPNVILEAMSVSKPVVSFRVEGIQELLGDDQLANRQAIKPNDFQAFANAIVEIAASQTLREQLGAFNRQRIEDHFQLDDLLERYEQLYLRHVTN